MSLEYQLSSILGVTEPPKIAAAVRAHTSAPERPTPLYEYIVRVRRSEYGTIYVTAADEDSAAEDADYGDIDWHDNGDVEQDDIDLADGTPVNQDDLDEWDSEYGDRFDYDGDARCSDCLVNYDLDELTEDADNQRWYCPSCCPDSLQPHDTP